MSAPSERLQNQTIVGGQKASHWVESVFPPAFSFTTDELLLQDGERCKDDGEQDGKDRKERSVYEMFAHGISPLDTARIKNVYERVWLMCAFEEEERKRRVEAEARDPEEQTTKEEAKSLDVVTSLGLSSEKTKELERIDVEDSKLWDSEEMEILRQVFKTAKAENSQLKARLKVNGDHVITLEKKCKKQLETLEKRAQKLKETRNANERLQILNTDLKKQLKAADANIAYLHQEIEDLRRELSDVLKAATNLKLNLDKEKIQRRTAESALVSQQRLSVLETERKKNELKLSHAKEQQSLRDQIKALTEELETEKANHHRSLKGLQHLRNHFSAVPLQGEESTKRANVVCVDQLENLTL